MPDLGEFLVTQRFMVGYTTWAELKRARRAWIEARDVGRQVRLAARRARRRLRWR